VVLKEHSINEKVYGYNVAVPIGADRHLEGDTWLELKMWNKIFEKPRADSLRAGAKLYSVS
jgi:hypothetical protein